MVFEEALPELKSGGIIGRSKWGFGTYLDFYDSSKRKITMVGYEDRPVRIWEPTSEDLLASDWRIVVKASVRRHAL